MISILICDDHAVVRYGMVAVIETHDAFRLVGAAENAEQALAIVARDPPDVAVLDLLMPGLNGIEAARAIREISPQTKVMLLTSVEGDGYLQDALAAGVRSYWLKTSGPAPLIEAILRTARGETMLHPSLAGAAMKLLRAPERASSDALTERELGVLQLIADGLSNADIASQLTISEKTVKNHVSAVLQKLSLSDRTQAAVYAWREGLK